MQIVLLYKPCLTIATCLVVKIIYTCNYVVLCSPTLTQKLGESLVFSHIEKFTWESGSMRLHVALDALDPTLSSSTTGAAIWSCLNSVWPPHTLCLPSRVQHSGQGLSYCKSALYRAHMYFSAHTHTYMYNAYNLTLTTHRRELTLD